MPATADDDVLGRLAGPGRIGVPAAAAAANGAAVDEAGGRTRLRRTSESRLRAEGGLSISAEAEPALRFDGDRVTARAARE